MKLPAITVHADLHPLGVFSWGPTPFGMQEIGRMGESLLLLLAVPGESSLASSLHLSLRAALWLTCGRSVHVFGFLHG